MWSLVSCVWASKIPKRASQIYNWWYMIHIRWYICTATDIVHLIYFYFLYHCYYLIWYFSSIFICFNYKNSEHLVWYITGETVASILRKKCMLLARNSSHSNKAIMNRNQWNQRASGCKTPNHIYRTIKIWIKGHRRHSMISIMNC